MIRKTIFIAVMAAFGILAANAQEEASTNRAAKRAEMTVKSAEKFVKEFNLEGDAQKSFVQTYSHYVEELANCDSAVKSGSSSESNQAGKKKAGSSRAGKKVDGKKAELTDAEATEKLNDMLARQQKAIEGMQARLEVQKKYVAEFGKVLTPAQVYKVMGRQRMQAGQRPGMQQGGHNRGSMGGMRPDRGFGGGGFDGGFGDGSF